MSRQQQTTNRMPAQRQVHPNAALANYLGRHREELVAALPKHLTPERAIRLACTAVNSSPLLRQATPESVIAAVVTASQLGLEIGVLGQAYLVPFKDKHGAVQATLVPGWRGLQQLVLRSGQANAWAGAVFRGDSFDFELGSSPRVVHRPSGNADPDDLVACYAVGKVNGAADPVVEVMAAPAIWEHRDKHNRQGDAHYSYAYPSEYGKKLCLLRVLRYLPATAELVNAMDLASGDGGLAVRGEFQALDGSTDTHADSADALTSVLEDIEASDTPEQLDLMRESIDALPSTQRKHALAAASARAAALKS